MVLVLTFFVNIELEASKQEEIAKAIFAEYEKYERMLVSLRAELKKQEQIKAKAEELDRLLKGTFKSLVLTILITRLLPKVKRRRRVPY